MVASLVAPPRGNEDTKNRRINQSHHGYSGTLPNNATRLTIKEVSPIAASSATAQPASASTTCTAITGLPLAANATCVKYDSDQDDGVMKNENIYVTSAAVDDVRRFYEGAFSQNGWTVTEFKHDVEDNAWSYVITQAQQRLKVEIEPGQGANGAITRITITEK
jgi:hypothetical protein